MDRFPCRPAVAAGLAAVGLIAGGLCAAGLISPVPGHAQELQDGAPTPIFGYLKGAKFVPGTQELLIAEYEGGVYRVDMVSGQVIGVLDRSDELKELRELAIAADGSTVAALYGGVEVRVWDTVDWKLVGQIDNSKLPRAPSPGEITAAAVSHDGRYVVAGYDGGWMQAFDVDALELTKPFHNIKRLEDMVFVPGTNTLLVNGAGILSEWDASTGKRARRFDTKLSGWTAISPDGLLIASGAGEGRVIISDAADGALLHEFQALETYVQALAFSPDGARLVAADSYGYLAMWDANSGDRIASFQTHEDAVEDVDFSPDGRRFVTASRNGIFDIRQADDQSLILSGTVTSFGWVTWTPDLSFVSSEDYGPKVFARHDATTGKFVRDERFLDERARPDLVAQALAAD